MGGEALQFTKKKGNTMPRKRLVASLSKRTNKEDSYFLLH